MNPSPSPNAGSILSTSGEQYGRYCSLLVSNGQGKFIDLSQLAIKFNVKKTGINTANAADIIVYNVSPETIAQLQTEFTQVILDAGYIGNYGRIFKGNIKQLISGRESATDTFVNLNCGDGDQALNFSTVNQTLAAGSTPQSALYTFLTALKAWNVDQGHTSPMPKIALPRGKTFFSNTKDQLTKLADSYGCNWSIQDGFAVFISETTYLPSNPFVMTSKTGMIGTPEQTTEGINVKSLLNPNINVYSRIQLDNKLIAKMKIDFWTPGSIANQPALINRDGMYFAWACEHTGDTRGEAWDTNLKLLTVDVTANPLDSVGSIG